MRDINTIYSFVRESDGVTLRRVNRTPEGGVTGVAISPSASLSIRNHSPDGFEFGYAGSGPAQLSLAILLDFAGREPAEAFYQLFKFKFIATAALSNTDHGEVTGQEIADFIREEQGK